MMPRIGRALMADSFSMLAGSVMGTTPTAAYVESSAGIAVGGRSGLTAVTTGICFIVRAILLTAFDSGNFTSYRSSFDHRWCFDGSSMAQVTWTNLSSRSQPS